VGLSSDWKNHQLCQCHPGGKKADVVGKRNARDVANAFDEQAIERLKCSESRVCLEVHETFGVQPTTIAEFARRNAALFRGEPAP
jgi:hypothetical protein